MTEFTHRILVSVGAGAPYDAARAAMAALTGEPHDAIAEWRPATDGTQDPESGGWVTTHRVACMLARASIIAQLGALAAATGGRWRALEESRDTTPVHLMTPAEALAELGLWLLEERDGTTERVERQI